MFSRGCKPNKDMGVRRSENAVKTSFVGTALSAREAHAEARGNLVAWTFMTYESLVEEMEMYACSRISYRAFTTRRYC
jgi:hypothetical protein